MNAKTTIFLLAAILILVVGLLVFPKARSEKEARIEATASSVPGKETPAPRPDAQEQTRTAHYEQRPHARVFPGEGHVPSNEASYKRWITYAVRECGIPFTQDEIDRVQQAYSEMMETRLAYEHQISSVEIVSDDEVNIVIPEYPEIGKKIRQGFENRMAEAIGMEKAEIFMSKAERMFDGANTYFGQTQQILNVKYVSSNGVIYYEIYHRRFGGGFVHRLPADKNKHSFELDIFRDKFPKHNLGNS
jgi:hypothetical protein